MPRRLSLFRLTKAHASWTIVAAPTAFDAEAIGPKLNDTAYEHPPIFIAEDITFLEDLPDGWAGESPWVDPDAKLAGNSNCAAYIPSARPPVDPRQEHALYQMIHGSIVLRPPLNAAECDLFAENGVSGTADGVYFTTIKPLPAKLQPYFVCYAIRPDGLSATQ